MIGGVLDLGRRMAESRMLDTCKVTRVTRGAFNEATGKHSVTTTDVYTGPCRVKHPTTAAKPADAGSQLVVVSGLELHLPLTGSGVRAGDVVEITASQTRAEEVGRKFTVVAPFDGTQTTALRFRVEVADGR